MDANALSKFLLYVAKLDAISPATAGQKGKKRGRGARLGRPINNGQTGRGAMGSSRVIFWVWVPRHATVTCGHGGTTICRIPTLTWMSCCFVSCRPLASWRIPTPESVKTVTVTHTPTRTLHELQRHYLDGLDTEKHGTGWSPTERTSPGPFGLRRKLARGSAMT